MEIGEKKKEIRLRPITKNPISTENSKINGQHKNATKKFDYTTMADRLRTVTWSNIIQLVWLNRLTGTQPSHLPQKPCNQKDTHSKICK